MRPRDILVRNLILIRRARGFTQEALAFEAEVDRSHVARIEQRVVSPTVAKLESIAAALDVSFTQLFDEAFTLEDAGIEPVPIRRKPRRRRDG